MKRILPLIVIAVLAYGYLQGSDFFSSDSAPASNDNSALLNAYIDKKSNVQVRGEGTVSKLLRDDLEGSRHQKFILQVGSGHTILVSHNIDLAPRIDDLRTGDKVEFFGEYEWSQKGGVVHWTHHDPGGRHVGGWLKHQGETYK